MSYPYIPDRKLVYEALQQESVKERQHIASLIKQSLTMSKTPSSDLEIGARAAAKIKTRMIKSKSDLRLSQG